MPRSFDAVVIGAGPAGSKAAYEIAISGLSVLLLEKHERPGLPLCCAEAVSKPSFDKIMKPFPEWVKAGISKIKIISPFGAEASIVHPEAGYVLDRTRLDYDLAQSAVRAGGSLECSAIGLELIKNGNGFSGLKVMKQGGEIEAIGARIYIAADGVESRIARLAGLPNLVEGDDIEALLQYRLEDINVDPEQMEFYVGNNIAPRGYIWVFPKSKQSANVGVAISVAREEGARTAYYLDNFINHRFNHYKIAGKYCGIVPRYQGTDKFRMKNLLIVGDAARSLDSLSGAGIVNAMLSGKYAGEAAVAFLKGRIKTIDDLDNVYPGRFLREKGGELSIYSKLRNVYNHLDDDDFEDIIKTLAAKFNGQSVKGINAVNILTGILKSRPRLLRLIRYLV